MSAGQPLDCPADGLDEADGLLDELGDGDCAPSALPPDEPAPVEPQALAASTARTANGTLAARRARGPRGDGEQVVAGRMGV